MKWLLTGCNGFIAKNVIEYFQDVNIIGLDLMSSELVPTIAQDVSEPISGEYDLIIHAASGYTGDIAMFNANFLGTKRCIEVASRTNAKLLYISSAEAYQPVRTYGIMKLAGEHLVKTYSNGYIVRPFHIYGPKMNLDDGRVQSTILKCLRDSEVFRMRGDGKAVRAFTHAKDLCSALLTVISLGKPGVVYDVTNEFESTSIEELCRNLGVPFVPGVEPHPIKESVGESSLLRRLGWRPTISTVPGFLECGRSYD